LKKIINIIITSPESTNLELTDLLRNDNINVISIPTIETVPIEIKINAYRIETLLKYNHWILFTSKNAINYFFDFLKSLCLDYNNFSHIKYGVVGKSSAELLKTFGLKTDLIPENFNSKSLVEEFLNSADPNSENKILFPTGKITEDFLPKSLNDNGFDVTRLNIYDTVIKSYSKESIGYYLTIDADCCVFTSPSGFINFTKLSLEPLIKKCKIASIGPSTTKKVNVRGYNVDIEPKTSTLIDLSKSIIKNYNNL